MQAVPHNVGDKSSSNVDERYFCKHRARDTTSHAHTDVNLHILTLPQKRIWKLLSTLEPHAAKSRDHMNRQSGKLIVTRLARGASRGVSKIFRNVCLKQINSIEEPRRWGSAQKEKVKVVSY